MRVLITGVTGFVGSYLADYLVSHHAAADVIGFKRWNSPLADLDHVADRINLIDIDITDPYSVQRGLRKARPDRIFHLAAQSYVPISFQAPQDTIQVNTMGTLALLEAIRESDLDPLIHVCSSSEVYGQVPESELPITENTPLRPHSPYGVSKVAEDLIAYQYYVSYGLKTIRSRAFTHNGPRGRALLVMPAFAKQIALLEAGTARDNIIRVGNLDSIRTFADVRDIVRAYWLLTEKCEVGQVYNIAGSHTATIRQMLDLLLSMSSINPEIVVDETLFRPSDITRQIADDTKFRAATAWAPKLSLAETAREVLDYWRVRVRRELDS